MIFAMLDYMNGRNDGIDIYAWQVCLMLIVFIVSHSLAQPALVCFSIKLHQTKKQLCCDNSSKT